MNGDTLEVMKAISDFRQEASVAISSLHTEFAGFKGSVETRIKVVEEEQAKTEKRQWVHSCIVLAGSILHHDLGQWLKWKL